MIIKSRGDVLTAGLGGDTGPLAVGTRAQRREVKHRQQGVAGIK
jgi:hypothetical protein